MSFLVVIVITEFAELKIIANWRNISTDPLLSGNLDLFMTTPPPLSKKYYLESESSMSKR